MSEGGGVRAKHEPSCGDEPEMAGEVKVIGVGDLCYAECDGQLYKAKVLALEREEEGERRYKVHYMGFKSNWDGWVEASRCQPDTPAVEAEANRRKEAVPAGRSVKRTKNEAHIAEVPSATRLVVDVKNDLVDDCRDHGDPSFLPLSLALKKRLVEDWESVTQARQLHSVPVPGYTVSEILREFMNERRQGGKQKTGAAGRKKKHKKAGKSAKDAPEGEDDTIPSLTNKEARYQELIDGLKMYFDRALPVVLLYRQERKQYNLLAKSHEIVQPSDMYGAYHLLRLFVKLPLLLATTGMSTAKLAQLQKGLTDVLKFLQRRADELFEDGLEADEEVIKELGGSMESEETEVSEERIQ